MNGETPKVHIFDPTIISGIDFSDLEGCSFNPAISPQNPGDNLVMRPLERDDYFKGYIQLLNQLTKSPEITEEQFHERFDAMKSHTSQDGYFVVVVEDVSCSQIVASTSVIIEYKFIRGCTLRARIEDVVVDENYRGRQLGKLMILTAKKLAKKLGAYKVSLDCATDKIPFYTKFGLANGECNFMVKGHLLLQHGTSSLVQPECISYYSHWSVFWSVMDENGASESFEQVDEDFLILVSGDYSPDTSHGSKIHPRAVKQCSSWMLQVDSCQK